VFEKMCVAMVCVVALARSITFATDDVPTNSDAPTQANTETAFTNEEPRIPQGMRVVRIRYQLRMKDEREGLIRPGDIVDVHRGLMAGPILNGTLTGSPAVLPVLEAVRVFAIDPLSLLVTPEQAKLVTAAANDSFIRVSLRNLPQRQRPQSRTDGITTPRDFIDTNELPAAAPTMTRVQHLRRAAESLSKAGHPEIARQMLHEATEIERSGRR